MKHTLTHQLKKLIPKQKNRNTLAIGGVLAIIVSLSLHTVFMSTHTPTPKDSELRFTEVSNKAGVLGSVMPASCQSYPVYGISHHFGEWFTHIGGGFDDPSFSWYVPADTFGYCPGTAPSAGVCGTTYATECTTGSWTNFSPGTPISTWQCLGTTVGAYSGATSGTCSYVVPVAPAVNIYFSN